MKKLSILLIVIAFFLTTTSCTKGPKLKIQSSQGWYKSENQKDFWCVWASGKEAIMIIDSNSTEKCILKGSILTSPKPNDIVILCNDEIIVAINDTNKFENIFDPVEIELKQGKNIIKLTSAKDCVITGKAKRLLSVGFKNVQIASINDDILLELKP